MSHGALEQGPDGICGAADEEGEKLAFYSSVLRLQAAGKHPCAVFFLWCVLRSCSPGFITKPLAAASAQAALTSWHLTLSISGRELRCCSSVDSSGLNFGKPGRARDETFRNLSCIS